VIYRRAFFPAPEPLLPPAAGEKRTERSAYFVPAIRFPVLS